ncbi:TPA: XRE family transcriptional regulator [Klebsiella pneumoniae]|uniref:XRE family transcriptional regulator n=1 Tax=Klebsiella TaxID=570 RepID=UPI0004354363|nr:MULTISPECIES: XRE family transcriptional regulator [Klebsiella]MCF7154182.1 XRE family transcriptional regulator [Klebsiella pneumoniae]MDG5840920.1 XRE family transcriptional regulator [Klebsiella pneumoniae]MDG5858330.1 XRE family transcriptional regulator [Klebsiella pneumoniae]MDK9407864.1 XRE family transcriptional regulator [Klebsiella pneumoniae]MDK9450111.1 XRE family transcriptional regulator [Klebsiella pneumoniae]
MPNLLQFSATPSGKGVAISASYDDGATISFSTDEQSANFMTSIVQALAAANKRVSAAENRAAAERRTADRKHKRTGDSYESGNMPTTCDAEFMRLVRAVCPKYNENTKDDDPRLVALDVLRYAPAEAFSAAYSRPMSEIQLSDAIDVLAQVGDYMKANNIEPKPYTTFDSIMAIGDAAKKAWGRK